MPARGHGTSSQQLRCHSRVGWRRAGELLARRSSSSYRLRCRNCFRSGRVRHEQERWGVLLLRRATVDTETHLRVAGHVDHRWRRRRERAGRAAGRLGLRVGKGGRERGDERVDSARRLPA